MKLYTFITFLAVATSSVHGAIRNHAIDWRNSEEGEVEKTLGRRESKTRRRELPSNRRALASKSSSGDDDDDGTSSIVQDSGRLEIRSVPGICIGVNNLEAVEDQRAIWVDCGLAPEFTMNDDHQLTFTAPAAPSSSSSKGKGHSYSYSTHSSHSSSSDPDWCLHAVSNTRVDIMECDKDEPRQIWYMSPVWGRADTWRFLNPFFMLFLGVYIERRPDSPSKSYSKSSTDAPIFFVPRLQVQLATLDEGAQYQWFVNLNCPDFAKGPLSSSSSSH